MPHTPNNELRKRHFEANMLDGVTLEDSKGSMISAQACFEYVEEAIARAVRENDKKWKDMIYHSTQGKVGLSTPKDE